MAPQNTVPDAEEIICGKLAGMSTWEVNRYRGTVATRTLMHGGQIGEGGWSMNVPSLAPASTQDLIFYLFVYFCGFVAKNVPGDRFSDSLHYIWGNIMKDFWESQSIQLISNLTCHIYTD